MGNRILVACMAVIGAGSLLAQAPASTASDSSPINGPFSIGPVNISGTVDGYYSFNNNHPANRVNKQHNFDAGANQFDLNMAKLRLEMAPEPVGFTFDFGFGTGMEIFSAGEPGNRNVVGSAGVVGNQFLNHVAQAYLSVKPKQLGGLQLDFGKFYTSAGAELVETYTNWNYSRSLLFTNGPFYHFGARAAVPVGKLTVGAQLVNGWNNVHENNSGKTGGITAVLGLSKVTWANTYYFGPENSALDPNGVLMTGGGKGFRNFFDTALTITPNDFFSWYGNYDYGSNSFGNNTSATWWTFATAAKIGPPKIYFAPRFEVYDDNDGFITGQSQTLKEITATVNYMAYDGVMMKFEYRHDWSNKPYFDRGQNVGTAKGQDTALVGLVFYFPVKK